MKYKTILITGGAGFIGSNLAISFKNRYPLLEVIVIDNLKRRGSELNLSRLRENCIDFIHGDIRNSEDLVLRKHIDLLIECSAEPAVLAGYGQNPRYIINTNLLGTVNCLELVRINKADLIFLSTSRVYPYEEINAIQSVELESRFDWEADSGVIGWSKQGFDKNFTTNGPKTLYGATKLASELLIQEYIAAYGIKAVINRCGVIAGPWQFGKVDQGIFAFWILSHYFKNNINYVGFNGKGKQVRDFVHVADLFELIDAQSNTLDKISGEVYNVGGGRENSLSLLELTRLCELITDNHLKIDSIATTRPGDIKIYITDNKVVTKRLDWRPKRSIKQILQDIFYWIKENEKELQYLGS